MEWLKSIYGALVDMYAEKFLPGQALHEVGHLVWA